MEAKQRNIVTQHVPSCGIRPPRFFPRRRTGILVCLLVLVGLSPGAFAGGGPENLFLVVNPRDHDSLTISNHYRHLSEIPASNIFYLDWDGDKFEKGQLTPEPASKVSPPLIKECPVCLECVVKQTLSLGTHDVFIAEIVAVQYDESVLDEQGRPDFNLAKPFAFAVGEYREIAGNIGSYGFSEGAL